MPVNYTKTTAAALWDLAICAVGLAIGVTFPTGWTVLAVLALLPPLLISRSWKDDRRMSERIHEALR